MLTHNVFEINFWPLTFENENNSGQLGDQNRETDSNFSANQGRMQRASIRLNRNIIG